MNGSTGGLTNMCAGVHLSQNLYLPPSPGVPPRSLSAARGSKKAPIPIDTVEDVREEFPGCQADFRNVEKYLKRISLDQSLISSRI